MAILQVKCNYISKVFHFLYALHTMPIDRVNFHTDSTQSMLKLNRIARSRVIGAQNMWTMLILPWDSIKIYIIFCVRQTIFDWAKLKRSIKMSDILCSISFSIINGWKKQNVGKKHFLKCDEITQRELASTVLPLTFYTRTAFRRMPTKVNQSHAAFVRT